MNILDIDRDFIISLMSDELTFDYIKEFSEFKMNIEKFKKVKNKEISCGPCVDNGLISPVSFRVISIIIDNYKNNNINFIDNLKKWTKLYYGLSDSVNLRLTYQQNSLSDIEEIII